MSLSFLEADRLLIDGFIITALIEFVKYTSGLLHVALLNTIFILLILFLQIINVICPRVLCYDSKNVVEVCPASIPQILFMKAIITSVKLPRIVESVNSVAVMEELKLAIIIDYDFPAVILDTKYTLLWGLVEKYRLQLLEKHTKLFVSSAESIKQRYHLFHIPRWSIIWYTHPDHYPAKTARSNRKLIIML